MCIRDRLQSIFPNPANAITCIPIKSDQRLEAQIELHDVLGRKLVSIFNGEIPAGESKYFFNASEYAAGTYFVQLKTSNGIVSQKVFID